MGGSNLKKNMLVSMENKRRKWHNKSKYLKYNIYLLKSDSSCISSYYVVQSERPSASVLKKKPPKEHYRMACYYYYTEITDLSKYFANIFLLLPVFYCFF